MCNSPLTSKHSAHRISRIPFIKVLLNQLKNKKTAQLVRAQAYVPASAGKLFKKLEGLMRLKIVALSLIAALMCCISVWAQQTTGSIAGTVKDQSGAVVAGATVTVNDTDKNISVASAKTSSGGDFNIPILPVGHYSLTIEAPNFQKYIQTGIGLNVNDKLTFFPVLHVGSTTQEVAVQAEANQVELQSTEQSGVVSGTQIRELSLNSRVYEQLVLLLPGTSSTNNTDQFYVGAFTPFGTNSPNISLNGGRTEENNWLVDGFDNVDRGSNTTLLTFPSVDAISEFRVIRGQYDPELGRTAGGQINVITRSGTSTLHGGAYEFWRNNILNANTPFLKASQRATCTTNGTPLSSQACNIPPYQHYNNFGWNIGGPAYIPKIYEQKTKTFFFFSQEWRRTITYTTPTADVPTSALLSGNFVHPVCLQWSTTNGATCTDNTHTAISMTPCAAGVTPGLTNNCISPVAAAYIKDIWSKVPGPNAPASLGDPFALIPTLRNVYNFREDMVRIDHTFSEKLSINGKVLRDTIPSIDPQAFFGGGTPIPGVSVTSTNAPGQNYSARATISLSPTLLIEPGYGYSYGAIVSNPIGSITNAASPNAAAAIESKLPYKSTLPRVPSLSVGGLSAISTFGPYQDYNRNHTAFGNGTKIVGGHTIKFGAIYYHYQKNENAAGGNQGSFTFSGTSGRPSSATLTAEQGWANFLVGHATAVSQTSLDAFPDIRDNQFEWYAQDTWRVLPNLTLTYGIRHSLFRQPTDALGRMSNWDPRFYSLAQAPCVTSSGALDVSLNAQGLPVSACNPNFNPLNGFIFNSQNIPTYFGFKGTASPWGSKIAPEDNRSIAPRVGVAWDPFGTGKTAIRSGFGMFYDSGVEFGNYEINVFNNPGFVSTFAPAPDNTIPGTGDLFDNPTAGSVGPSGGANPFNTAKQFFSLADPHYRTPYTEQWSLDVQHEFGHGWMADLGYVGNHGVRLPGLLDPNQPTPDSWVNCTAATPCYGGPAQANKVTFGSVPNAVACTAAQISGGTCLIPAATPDLSNFNKLNALRPVIGYAGIRGSRMIFGSNYNGFQSQLQKAFSSGSLINVAYTWSHGLTTNQFDRSTGSVVPQVTSNMVNNYGPSAADRRQILTGNFVYVIPWLRPQQGFVGHVFGGWEVSGIQTFQTGLPLTVLSPQDIDPTGAGCLGSSPCVIRANQNGDPNAGAPHQLTQWFNPTVFSDASPSQTTITTGRPGSVRLPGFWRTDLSLFKNIKFSERATMQLRFETFNTFNHFNPVCCGSGTTSSSSFNKVLSARDPRIMQLGAKFNF